MLTKVSAWIETMFNMIFHDQFITQFDYEANGVRGLWAEGTLVWKVKLVVYQWVIYFMNCIDQWLLLLVQYIDFPAELFTVPDTTNIEATILQWE